MNNKTTSAGKPAEIKLKDSGRIGEVGVTIPGVKLDVIKTDGKEMVTFARKPRLPKKLIILSVEWEITYHNNSYEVDEHKQGKFWGQTDFDYNKIRILKAGRSKEAIWCTLFHEILHILFHHLDIDDILGSKEENVTVALSSVLNDFFWRNFRQ